MTAAPVARTKICGLTREADVAAVVSAGADAVGVVADVSVETPREVSLDRARDLLGGLPPFVTGVLVTMPDAVEAARDRLDRAGADALQVHGLAPPVVRQLADLVDRPVIAAVGVDGDVAAHAAAADAVLLDSLDEQGGGGTGERHDWARAATLVEDLDVPVVLAGGLTPANVREAVEQVGPFAVDVASGVERRGGVKDHDAVRSFVTRATGQRGVEA